MVSAGLPPILNNVGESETGQQREMHPLVRTYVQYMARFAAAFGSLNVNVERNA